MNCPHCHKEMKIIGRQGDIIYYKCPICGHQDNREVRVINDSKREE